MMTVAGIMVPSSARKNGFAVENIGVIFIFWKKNKNLNILNEYMSYEYLSIFCYYPKYILRTY